MTVKLFQIFTGLTITVIMKVKYIKYLHGHATFLKLQLPGNLLE